MISAVAAGLGLIWSKAIGLGRVAQAYMTFKRGRQQAEDREDGRREERERSKDEAIKNARIAMDERRSDDDSVRGFDRDTNDW